MKQQTIFRSKPTRDFTTFPNALLRDKSLSFRARGLLAMVLSNSDSWEVTKSWIQDQGTEGREAIISALDELRKAGYVHVRQERGDGNQFTRVVWEFFDVPHEADPQIPEPEEPRDTGSRDTGSRITATRLPGNPQQRKTIGTEEQSEQKNNYKAPAVRTFQKFQKPTLEEVREFFAEIEMPISDADAWFYGKEGNGWMNGRTPVKDWKATARNWKASGWLPSQKAFTPRVNGRAARPETAEDLAREKRIAEMCARNGHSA